MKQPLIVNYGSGVDSTAMLYEFGRRGTRPNLVIFADTGGEKPETYEYLNVMDEWLRKEGFPLITRVAYKPTRAKYRTLEENCLVNGTLPSLAFGYKSCSLKFKAEVMDRWILGVTRGVNRCDPWPLAVKAKNHRIKIVKCIGYDAGPRDSRRCVNKTEDDNFVYRYPLREWGWDRERCIAEIKKAGQPVPLKSACFFCPASKAWELKWLAARHPELLLRSLEIERAAREGEHGLGNVKGLWRRESWTEWCEKHGIIKNGKVAMSQAKLLKLAAAEKPCGEANE